ncbi:MAG: hypothetical protein ACKOCH_21670, partial [Bacteroidota bacterium]
MDAPLLAVLFDDAVFFVVVAVLAGVALLVPVDGLLAELLFVAGAAGFAVAVRVSFSREPVFD